MQVNQVRQNHKSNPAFQQLTVNLKSQKGELIFDALRHALLPAEGEIISPIISHAMKNDITIFDRNNELFLGVQSDKKKKFIFVEDILELEKSDTVIPFAAKIKTAFGELFGRVTKIRQLQEDVLKYLNP